MTAPQTNTLAPRIPRGFGPHRAAALLESQAGWCCICDELPIKNWKRTSHRFTCGRPECTREWARLCQQDALQKTPTRAVHFDREGRVACSLDRYEQAQTRIGWEPPLTKNREQVTCFRCRRMRVFKSASAA